MKNTEIFAKNLVRMMRREDISQRELARRANLSEAAVSRYVQGKRFPNSKAMIELSKALNCSIEDLMQEPTESELESIIKKAISSLNESERNFLISELRMVRSKKYHKIYFCHIKAMIEYKKVKNNSEVNLLRYYSFNAI